MDVTKRFFISGKVQGVFFRATTAEQAQALSLRGWVRNLPDGRVECLVAGPITELNVLEQWLNQGPKHAEVSSVVVEVEDKPFEGEDFKVVP